MTRSEKLYYCPLKANRLVDDSGGSAPYVRVDKLVWSAQELQQGKCIKVRGFPKDKKVKLFRVTVSTHRTDYVATNDLTQADTDAVQDVCDIRWKIEEFHRELKQLTGVEACVFVAKLVFNAITLPVPCSFGVGSSRSPPRAAERFISSNTGCSQTTCQLQLKHPSIQMSLA